MKSEFTTIRNMANNCIYRGELIGFCPGSADEESGYFARDQQMQNQHCAELAFRASKRIVEERTAKDQSA